MTRRACFLLGILVAVATIFLACGSNNRSLQSVSVRPTAAQSKAQFTAMGTYNQMPTSVDITNTATWCIGTTGGMCDADIAIEASVTSGLALCASGFSGTLTVLAGQPGPPPGMNLGSQLKPFGAAQLTCP